MDRPFSGLATAVFASAMAMLAATGAEAGSFDLMQQSTIGQGQNFAGVAAGSAGLGSIYWNPATMTAMPGVQAQVNAAALFPFANLTPAAGTSPALLGLGGTGSTGDILYNAVLPSAYGSYQVDDRLWLGLSVSSPFGLISKNPFDSAGQIYARTTDIRSYDFNPTAAFKVTDWLSLGAGIEAEFLEMKLSEAVSPFPGAPTATLRGNSWGVGYTLGVTVTPQTGTEFGVGYRSAVAQGLQGTARIDGLPSVPAKASLQLPDQVNVGVRQSFGPDLTLAAGYQWTQWSRLGTVVVRDPLGGATLPFNYSDGSAVNVGGEYRWNPQVTVRSGIGYEWSPISIANRSTRAPDGDRLSLSAGLGYRVSDNLTVDFAYSHYFLLNDDKLMLIPGEPQYVGLPLVETVSANGDVASLGLTYRW